MDAARIYVGKTAYYFGVDNRDDILIKPGLNRPIKMPYDGAIQ